jgi:hypothetical protein
VKMMRGRGARLKRENIRRTARPQA